MCERERKKEHTRERGKGNVVRDTGTQSLKKWCSTKMCVCVRERERDRKKSVHTIDAQKERVTKRERETHTHTHTHVRHAGSHTKRDV